MDTNETTETEVTTENGNGEGGQSAENVSVAKADYDKLNQTLGSLKRELKDLKKAKEEPVKETPINTKTEESALLKKLENLAFRQEGITHPDDKEFALSTAKKWNMDLDEVLLDEDFKAKLGREQAKRENAVAASNVRGSAGTTQAKLTPEYWKAKGVPPSRADVPDRKARAKIVRAMMEAAETDGKKFYND